MLLVSNVNSSWLPSISMTTICSGNQLSFTHQSAYTSAGFPMSTSVTDLSFTLYLPFSSFIAFFGQTERCPVCDLIVEVLMGINFDMLTGVTRHDF